MRENERTMLIIERDNNGFIVRAKEVGMGRGPKANAANTKEVAMAVQHYFDGNHFATATGGKRGCPFCRKPSPKTTDRR
jgi:hypothetical protein